MKSIPGVKNTTVFAPKKVVVYYHDMNIADAEQVYNQKLFKSF
jgi:hypothetical protein